MENTGFAVAANKMARPPAQFSIFVERRGSELYCSRQRVSSSLIILESISEPTSQRFP